jgi:hypothetical protein
MITTRLLTLTVLGAWLVACAGENEPATSNDPLTGGSTTPTTAATPPPGTTAAPAATPPPATASAPPATTAAPTAAPAAGACDEVNYDPKCDLTPTVAGEEIKKGTACTEADPQCCWRSCGPQSIGWKTEQCVAGVYAEGDCQFPPAGDYSCYAIPDAIDATVCPQDAPPKSGDACTVPECTLCNLDDTYFDSGGSSKTGYCVCQAPNAEGTRTWSCGSTSAWPCPLGQGCQ